MQQTGPGWVPVVGAEGMAPYTQGSHTSAWRTYPSTPSPRRLQALPCQVSLGFLISPTHTLSAPDAAYKQSSELALISWRGGQWGHVIP